MYVRLRFYNLKLEYYASAINWFSSCCVDQIFPNHGREMFSAPRLRQARWFIHHATLELPVDRRGVTRDHYGATTETFGR